MKRSDKEILEDLKDVECGLSPENLSCDGEASRTYIRQQEAKLNRQRKALVKELGREPTFEEIWGSQ